MAIEIFMPALSPTMEKGTLAKWLVKEGDTVTAGDVIAEIETDKATMEVESIDEGTVGKILVAEGTEDVPVGDLIALLLEEGEDASALEGGDSSASASTDKPATDEPAAKTEAEPTKTAEATRPEANEPAKEDKAEPAPAAPTTADGDRVFASPLARRMAKQMGLDLTGVKGTGPKGRIVKADVEAASGKAPKPEKAEKADMPVADQYKAAQQAALPAASQPDFTPPVDVPYDEVKLTGMRKVIARRMTESKQQVPHFYLTIDVSVDALLAQRKALNEKLADQGVKLSVNDFVIRACALSLRKVPAANAMFAGDKMYRFTRQDISVAVAVDGGLVTPVIRDAGGKGLADISTEMKDLAAKARDGKLTPEEMSGGTFSISNLGMYGIREFGAVINPPQGAILAVGAGQKRPVVEGDAVAIKTMMTVTLSVDHRVLDGAIGSEFLSVFKSLIEDPMMMLV